MVVLLALSVFLGLRGIHRDSPTEDEWAHLVRGISYWQQSDMRIHVQHPPLANALEGLPSAFDDNPDTSKMKTWNEGYSPGLEYIKHDYAKARQQLTKGRYAAMVFLVGLVAYVFYFCLSIFGFPTAAAAALLIAFNPTVLGQARYVATDMPAATMATIAVGELVRYLVNPKRVLTLGLALGGLVLAKHSGVVFVAMIGLIALLVAALGRASFRGKSPLRRLGEWAVHWVIAGAIVVLTINVVYKFDRTGMRVGDILEAPEPQHWVTKRFKDEMLETRTFLPKLPENLRIPLPYPYLFGLFAVQEQNRMGYPTSFMGQSSQHGHWAYFPVLLALKDPPALLFLLGLGAVIAGVSFKRTRRIAARDGPRESEPRADEPFLLGMSLASSCFLLVALMFLAFLMRSDLNMGIRHGLPFIPMVSVLGARAFARAGELLQGNALLAAQVVGLSGIVSVLVTMPRYLNYYNVFALGKGSYINVVGDDWGQDREDFVRFVKKQNLQPLYYHAQTATRALEVQFLQLEYRGLECKTRPRPGAWAAIHVQYVYRWQATPGCAPWLRGLTPVYKVNENIWIYKVPEAKGTSG